MPPPITTLVLLDAITPYIGLQVLLQKPYIPKIDEDANPIVDLEENLPIASSIDALIILACACCIFQPLQRYRDWAFQLGTSFVHVVAFELILVEPSNYNIFALSSPNIAKWEQAM